MTVLVGMAFPPPGGAKASPSDHVDTELQIPRGEELTETRTVRLVGQKGSKPGECVMSFPELSLPEGDGMITAQPILIDYADCSVVWEVGEPVDGLAETSAEESAADGEFGAGVAEGTAASELEDVVVAAASTSAFYRVRWHDVVHITTTRLQSNIYWSYDGSRILSSSGSWSDYLAVGTGWYRKSGPTAYIYRPSSTRHYVQTDGVYQNNIFCSAMSITTYYDNVRVSGYSDGSKTGAVDGTWTTENPSWLAWKCPNLHFHVTLGSPA